MRKERNIGVFNRDVAQRGHYVYTNPNCYSARIATQRQTNEIVDAIRTHHGLGVRILDIGCGDGAYTLELASLLRPALIEGCDAAGSAIEAARRRADTGQAGGARFQVANIYEVDKHYRRGQFDVAVLRGVLHHLNGPREAIEQVTQLVDSVLVLEPNGYNPVLKMIERFSAYHREHDEKSYFPPHIDRWFARHGYRPVRRRFFGVVPYFCPDWFARLLEAVQPYAEQLPGLTRIYCGTYLALFVR